MLHSLLRTARVALLVAAVSLSATAGRSPSCPFCVGEKGPTLLGDYKQAVLVLVGTFANAKLDAASGLEGGSTDFLVEEVLKPHPIVAGKKVIRLPKYIPPTKSRFVLFCDVYKGVLDPYRGVEVQPKSQLVQYLKGALSRKGQPIADRLRYCFDYLNSPEMEVALDAYREFQKAAYEEYRPMAKGLPAATLVAWLQDPATPAYRYGLYGSLLGHCGKLEDAKVLRKMLADPEKVKSSGVDGLMAGYLLILARDGHGQEGLDYVRGILRDAQQPFATRYAALRTVRWFWDARPDVFSKEALTQTICLLLAQPDMADFAIEDLGKWRRWDKCDEVLDLFGKASHSAPVIKRSILRFALRCPRPRAVEFVRRQRGRDAEWVNDTEELLRLEAPAKSQ